MPRQDSLADQITSLSVLLDAQGHPDLAAWLRGDKPTPSAKEMLVASKIAIRHGCYDADDWIKDQMGVRFRS